MQVFEIQAMACGGCASRIVQVVKSLDGQARVEVDLAMKRVSVDTSADRASVVEALTASGYRPT